MIDKKTTYSACGMHQHVVLWPPELHDLSVGNNYSVRFNRLTNMLTNVTVFVRKGAITSKIKHAIKVKTSPARIARLLQPSVRQ